MTPAEHGSLGLSDTPSTCDGRFWQAGMDNRCTQSVALTRWVDSTGVPHAGCPRHAGGLQRRFPEALIEEAPTHGTLALSTPWARDVFGPNDRIAVANAIPPGWVLGVSVAANRSRVILWLNDPSGTERHRWTNQPLRAAVPAALDMARLAQALVAEGPEPTGVQRVPGLLQYAPLWAEFGAWESKAAKAGSGMTRDQMTGAAMMLGWLTAQSRAALPEPESADPITQALVAEGPEPEGVVA